MAIAFDPLDILDLPKEIAKSPVLALLVPIAIADCPLELEKLPIASESDPFA